MSFEIPRHPVPMWRLFLRMGGWWVVGAGVFVLMFTLFSHSALSLAKQFEAEGQVALATVQERYTTTSRDSDGDTTTSYWLTLYYILEDGAEITHSETVGTSLFNEIREGDTLPILYLPGRPTTIEVNPGQNRRDSRIVQGIALVFGLAFLGSLWLVGGWSVAAVRARRFGARRTAVITEIATTNVKVNGRRRLRLKWRDEDGALGESLMQKRENMHGFRAGDTIEIYKGLKRNWWVGDVGERPEFAR